MLRRMDTAKPAPEGIRLKIHEAVADKLSKALRTRRSGAGKRIWMSAALAAGGEDGKTIEVHSNVSLKGAMGAAALSMPRANGKSYLAAHLRPGIPDARTACRRSSRRPVSSRAGLRFVRQMLREDGYRYLDSATRWRLRCPAAWDRTARLPWALSIRVGNRRRARSMGSEWRSDSWPTPSWASRDHRCAVFIAPWHLACRAGGMIW